MQRRHTLARQPLCCVEERPVRSEGRRDSARALVPAELRLDGVAIDCRGVRQPGIGDRSAGLIQHDRFQLPRSRRREQVRGTDDPCLGLLHRSLWTEIDGGFHAQSAALASDFQETNRRCVVAPGGFRSRASRRRWGRSSHRAAENLPKTPARWRAYHRVWPRRRRGFLSSFELLLISDT